MEDNKKYYNTPIEDLFIGYECEIQTSWGYVKGIWPEILQQDSHINLFSKGTIRQQITTADLRTKYLDKEDIESCGWEFLEERAYVDFYEWPKEIIKNKHYKLFVNINKQENSPKRIIHIDSPIGDISFRGICKSKNELRTLMKWLDIK